MPVTCPNCGSDNLVSPGPSEQGRIRVLCLACGHEWTRGDTDSRIQVQQQSGQPDEPSIFIDDDRGYVTWTERFPYGYVVNTSRTPSAHYLILHEASCVHITVPFGSGNRWTHTYIKVCSPRKRDLIAWAERELGVAPQRCGSCQP
jgi:hypothetical protein